MKLDDLTLGDLADAVNELRRLRERVDELLEANTREVERRRRVEEAAREALHLLELHAVPNPVTIGLIREALNACPRCGAVSGEPCRTDNVRAALPTPHEERGAKP